MYKPCPFCGVEQIGNAETYIEAEIVGLPNRPDGRPTDRPLAAVKCQNCGTYGPVAGAEGRNAREGAMALAMARWNDRRAK